MALGMYRFFLFLWLVVSLNVYSEGTESLKDAYQPINDRAVLPILTPAFAKRKTQKIVLKNGLKALLISDPDADKSSAVLSVNVGSWEDPAAYPGIAHFLEHMLFLGTKKYPKESEYQRFVSEHGGLSNAFTSNDKTSYLFSIDHDAFPEALDRFANFFKEPLFNPSGVARELNAIDQEYAKNVENDDVRLIFIIKELGNPNHPNHNFNIGNTLTLSKVSQDTLKQWYRDHYSADAMRLIVTSPLPMDSLISLVVKDFGDIPQHPIKREVPDVPLASGALEGKMVYIQPIKNIRTLTMVWDLPTVFGTMKDTKPDELICAVLGHEGEESLLAELKHRGLGEKLNCGAVRIGGDHLNFYMQVELTDEGVHKVNEVILLCFEMIGILKEKGVPEYLYYETQNIEKIGYQYQKREDAFLLAMKGASSLWDEDMETYPEQGMIIQQFNQNHIHDFLMQLTPKNCQFYLGAPSSLTGVKPNQKEKWMGVEYAVMPLSPEVMASWEKAVHSNSPLNIPSPNAFIPTHLSLIKNTEENKEALPLVPHPQLIVNDEKGKIYYAYDERYRVPEAYWNFKIKSPEILEGRPAKVVIADLFVKSVKEALNKFTYNATLAGLDYKIEHKDYGITINIHGYSEKIYLLLDEVLKQIHSLNITEEKFEIYKQSLLREYQNASFDPPLKQASETLKSILYKSFTSSKQKAVALRKVTYDKFTAALQTLFKQTFIEGMIYGNVSEQEALVQSEKFLHTFRSSPYPLNDQIYPKIILLPSEEGPFYIEENSKVSGNAVILAIEYVPYTFQTRAAHQLLMQAMSEPFFTSLRTKQQTGYVVYSSGEELERHLFHIFAVQSNSHEVRDLLARFELFIESYLQELGKTELLESNFQTIKKALITKLEQPQNNLGEMGELLTLLAFKYDGDFDWMTKRIVTMKELKYADLLLYAKEALGRENKRRLGILLKGSIPENNTLEYIPLCNLNQLRKMSTYEGSQNK